MGAYGNAYSRSCFSIHIPPAPGTARHTCRLRGIRFVFSGSGLRPVSEQIRFRRNRVRAKPPGAEACSEASMPRRLRPEDSVFPNTCLLKYKRRPQPVKGRERPSAPNLHPLRANSQSECLRHRVAPQPVGPTPPQAEDRKLPCFFHSPAGFGLS